MRELFCVMLLLEWASEKREALDLHPTAHNGEPERADLATALFSNLDPQNWYGPESLRPQLEKLGVMLSRAAQASGSRHAGALKILGEAVSSVARLRAADVEYVSYSFTPHEDEKATPSRLLQLFDAVGAELGNRGRQFFTPREWVRKLVRDVSGPNCAIRGADTSMSTELFLARVAEHMASVVIDGKNQERDLPYDARLNNHEFLVGLTRYVLSEDDDEADSGLATKPFEFVLTNPPFGRTMARAIRQRSGGDATSVSAPEAFFLESIVKTLRPGSRAAIIVPAGFLTRESAAPLRRWLIERGILDTVILLPLGIFPEAPKVRAAILSLAYHGAEGAIQIIDASALDSAREPAVRFERAAEPQVISHLFHTRVEGVGDGVPCEFEFLDRTQLSAKRWKIELSRQALKRPSWLDTELGKLLGAQQRIVLLERHACLRVGLYVKNKCLESGARPAESIGYLRISDYGNCQMKEPTLWFLPDKVKGSAECLLEAGDVLVSRSGTIGKAVVFNMLEQPAIACIGIYVVRTDPSTLDPDFLVAYIHSASCQQLLQMRAQRSVYPNLRKENVLSLQMPLPSLKVQRSVAAEARKTGEDLLACLARALGTSLRTERTGS